MPAPKFRHKFFPRIWSLFCAMLGDLLRKWGLKRQNLEQRDRLADPTLFDMTPARAARKARWAVQRKVYTIRRAILRKLGLLREVDHSSTAGSYHGFAERGPFEACDAPGSKSVGGGVQPDFDTPPAGDDAAIATANAFYRKCGVDDVPSPRVIQSQDIRESISPGENKTRIITNIGTNPDGEHLVMEIVSDHTGVFSEAQTPIIRKWREGDPSRAG